MMVCAGQFAQGHFRAGAKQDMLSIYTRDISFNTEEVVNLGPVIGEAGQTAASCGLPDLSVAATWKEGGEEEIVGSLRALDLLLTRYVRLHSQIHLGGSRKYLIFEVELHNVRAAESKKD